MKEKSALTRVEPKVAPIRRIVTGHDAQGRSIVVSDSASPHVECILGIPTLASTELWTDGTPANNVRGGDPVTLPISVPPPANGTTFRVVEFPPDRDWKDSLSPSAGLGKPASGISAKNPMMHRTKSLDYVVVISGEIWSILDEGEVLMRAGDVMVQRGTNHAWANRSDKPCAVAFVLIDAAPVPGLETH